MKPLFSQILEHNTTSNTVTSNFLLPSRPGKLLAETPRGRFIAAVKRLVVIFSDGRPADFSGAHAVRSFLNGIQSQLEGGFHCDTFGIPGLLRGTEAAEILCNYLGADKSMAISVILAETLAETNFSHEMIEKEFGSDVRTLVAGLTEIHDLYKKSAALKSDNFRDLMLTLAKDIRVIILMLADRVALMRAVNHHPAQERVKDLALEAGYLYAPLAHRLGLYGIKSELEDLSLKYSARETYTEIAHKLNQTKKVREAYIAAFIAPVKEKLEEAGLKFTIKGRTKSISSIWNKIRKQQTDLEHIYDLFAIRVIIDCELEKEKAQCWLAYSIITDMFRPNPARMKDWIGIPKSNGYESLHVTVYGPGERWVEVQIRTRRMDLVAEKGLAAHWKYKGVKSEEGLDLWMNNVRDILEAGKSGPMDLVKNMRTDIYDKEVFVFSPRGDLYRLPMGATLLDFAFQIHTRLGCQCTGGRINGVNCKINRRLASGDTVEIFTSPQQKPKLDWLAFTVTSKARNKIRVALKESETNTAELGRELLLRRLKNRKIDFNESVVNRLVKKAGYKTLTDFFISLQNGLIDIGSMLDAYQAMIEEDRKGEEETPVSASEFVLEQEDIAGVGQSSETVVIGEGVKNVNYKFAQCCNPINGDDVFGFISSGGIIKIHKKTCPNAIHLSSRYPYRLIKVQWSGLGGELFTATINIVGKDDISILTNVTSLIKKEKDIKLRNITVNSVDGLFQGNLSVGVSDTVALNALIKKLLTIKGIKKVERS